MARTTEASASRTNLWKVGTAVILQYNRIIFGKNSDRPCDEVQEVVYFPAAVHDNLKEHLKVGEMHILLTIFFFKNVKNSV